MDDMAVGKDWDRLARYVRERREELGMTQEDVRMAGGPSTATMRLIEGAHQRGYQPMILRRLDKALGWTSDSHQRILEGREPVPLDRPPPPRQVSLADAGAAADIQALTSYRPPGRPQDEIYATLPHVVTIAVQLGVLKSRGIPPQDAAGEQVFPDSHLDRFNWDRLMGAPLEQRVWVVATLRMWDAQRNTAQDGYAAGLARHVRLAR